MDKVNNGDELYKVLIDNVESFDYFSKEKGSNICEVLDGVKNRNDLIEIELEEETNFDDGDPYQFYLKYDFGQSKVIELEDGYCEEP